MGSDSTGLAICNQHPCPSGCLQLSLLPGYQMAPIYSNVTMPTSLPASFCQFDQLLPVINLQAVAIQPTYSNSPSKAAGSLGSPADVPKRSA